MTSDLDETTDRVRAFYEQNPYPGLGDKLMMGGARRISRSIQRPGRILFPGCGTGHGPVSLATIRPDLEVFGLDLSEPSLDVARKLATRHNVDAEFIQADYMKALPWPFKFPYICLQGTLHHAAEPSTALRNLVDHLEDDGLVWINLYGKKYHRRRFEIIEVLDLLQQGNVSLEQRYALFKAMQARMNQRGVKDILMDASPRMAWRWIYRSYRGLKNRLSNNADSVPWTSEFPELSPLWVDQYSNPNERTYDIWEVKDLVESANLEVVEMYSLGKVRIHDLPGLWRPLFDKLDVWTQRRVTELYPPNTGSVNLLARKRS